MKPLLLALFSLAAFGQTTVLVPTVNLCPAGQVMTATPGLTLGSYTIVSLTCGSVIPPSVVPRFSDFEKPTGNVDGANIAFKLANAPNPPASLQLYRNGLQQAQGGDYTLGGTGIMFLPGAIPQAGDTLVAWYRY